MAVLLVYQLYSINREVLWRLLRHYGMPDKVVTIIRALYEGFSAQVVHNGQRTQPLNMRTGLRQGCLISPLLFLVALDWVTRTAFDRKRGIQWTFTTSLEDLVFADDLALLSRRIQDMRDKRRALEEQGAKVRPEDQCHQDKVDAYSLVPNAAMVCRLQGGGLRKWMSSLTLGAL